ncbi:MAG: hypothetical protein R6W82_06255 [bacterium]
MKRVSTLSGLLLFALLSALPVQAQTPDLSGTWVYNPDKSILPTTERVGAARRAGSEIVIKQEGDTITITRQMRTRDGSRSMDTVIVADGKPHEQSMGRRTITVTARWQEDKLVVERLMPAGRRGGGSTATETYSLRNDGQLLLIDSTDRQGELISRAYDRKK